MRNMKYPQEKYNSYPSGSVERKALSCLNGWQERNWPRMQKFFTETYKHTHLNKTPKKEVMYDHEQEKYVWAYPPETWEKLHDTFKRYDLKGIEIIGTPEIINDVMCDMKLRLWINPISGRTGENIIEIDTEIRLVKEKEAYKPDKCGNWGVNPPSMFGIFDKVSKAGQNSVVK